MTSLSPQDQAVEIQEHHEESHPDHRMFGLATFLVADAMTFAGFFAAYLTFKAVNPLLPGAVYELELPLPTLNTILLLVSSATFHRAGVNLRRSDMQRCRRWLLLTAILGLAFLVSQMICLFCFVKKKCKQKNFKIAIKQFSFLHRPLKKCQIKNIYKIKYFCYIS